MYSITNENWRDWWPFALLHSIQALGCDTLKTRKKYK